METKSWHNYLRAIYSLLEDKEEVSTNSIAKALGIKPASVTEMMHKLAKEGYLVHKPYRGIKLTKKGEREAIKAIRRHRIVEDFLIRVLKINKKDVLKQALSMEYSLTDKTEIELCRFLERPMEDPIEHKPIPHCEKKISCERCLAGKG